MKLSVVKLTLTLLVNLSFLNGLWAQNTLTQEFLLRDKKTPCGFYLAKLKSEFTGTRLTNDLDVTHLRSHLKKIDPTTDRIVAVGVAPDWVSRKELKTSLKQALVDAGIPHAKYSVVRRISDLIEDKVGVFIHQPDGTIKKISSLDPNEISRIDPQELILSLQNGGSLMVSGTPLIGPTKEKIKQTLESQLKTGMQTNPWHPTEPVKIQNTSSWALWAQHFALNPKKALNSYWHKLRALIPYSEDYVKPTDGEIRSMGQKVTMHTLLSVVSFAAQGESLQVAVPVTVVNTANSVTTGTLRSTIGNWFSRSHGALDRTIKGVMLTSFFTFDLYLAKHLLDGQTLSSFLGTSGWVNFMATNWVAILFQSMWRIPVLSVLNKWERWRSHKDGATVSAWARNVGGNTEKFLTYAMTQLYLLSMVLESSLFKVAYSQQNGVFFKSSDPTPLNDRFLEETLLMNFNYGHLGMATVGAMALMMSKHYRAFDRVAPAVEWLDSIENKFYTNLLKPLRYFTKKP